MIHPEYWSALSIYCKLMGKSPYYHFSLNDYRTLDVMGKVVLDIGAYDGDTAKYFLKRGARRVICIERDKERAYRIPRSPKIDPVLAEPFKLEHLNIPHDCMKMDIEGYEIILLNYKGKLKPSIIEVHNWYLHDKFKELGFHHIYEPDSMLGVCVMSNF